VWGGYDDVPALADSFDFWGYYAMIEADEKQNGQ